VIHPTAIIEAGAKIHESVEIGPYSVIGGKVDIDAGTVVASHVVINGLTRIGKHNHIFQFSSVGETTPDKKYKGEETRFEMGDNNVVRECVTLHRGTVQDRGITCIGNDNLFMANSHVAHDCVVGNHNIMANSAAIAGHVVMGDYINIGGMCGVHQFCKIGSHAFISVASMVVKDVPPYVMVTGGASTTVCGLNVEGLKRRGFTADDIEWLRRAYKVIYRQGLRAQEAIIVLREMEKECAAVKLFADFLASSERGIIRYDSYI
jgi:UDP-N-acetylglucosamine acyltransferase